VAVAKEAVEVRAAAVRVVVAAARAQVAVQDRARAPGLVAHRQAATARRLLATAARPQVAAGARPARPRRRVPAEVRHDRTRRLERHVRHRLRRGTK